MFLFVLVGFLFFEQSAFFLAAPKGQGKYHVAHEYTQSKEHTYAQQNELIAQSYEICCVVTEHNVLVGDE